MATYYFAVAFNTDSTLDPQTDGTHYDAQYGFGLDSGNGINPLGSSGGTGRQFEVVNINASSGGRPNQLVVTLMSNIIGINTSSSFFRGAFRPAHDVVPASGLPTSPLNNSDSQSLLSGVLLSSNSATNVNITNAASYGLPEGSFSTQWVFPAYQLNQGASGTNVHFELTVEITVVVGNGTPTVFKIDPEMIIDY